MTARPDVPPILFVTNPRAGSTPDAASAEFAASAAEHPEVEVATPDDVEAGFARLRAAAAEGRRRVIVAGGDGTIHAAVNALAPGFEVELGIVPLGTGNDLARAAGLPDDPAAALALAIEGPARPTDLACVRLPGGRVLYAANACTGGFGAKVSEALSDRAKQLVGPLAYVLAAGRALADLEEHVLRLEIDGEDEAGPRAESLEAVGVQVFVSNGTTVAGGVPVAPDAVLDDGLLDLVLVLSLPLGQLARVAARVVAGTHADDPGTLVRRVRRVAIAADPPLPFNADGELFGETPLVVEVAPGRLRLVR